MKTILLLALLSSSSAFAAQSNIFLNIGSILQPSCELSSSNVPFGLVSATNGNTTSGSLSVICNRLTSYTVKYGPGRSTINTNRYMTNTNGDKLYYNVYQASDYINILGDGTAGTAVKSAFAIGMSQNWPMYFRLPSGQYVKPDAYTDNITLTVEY